MGKRGLPSLGRVLFDFTYFQFALPSKWTDLVFHVNTPRAINIISTGMIIFILIFFVRILTKRVSHYSGL